MHLSSNLTLEVQEAAEVAVRAKLKQVAIERLEEAEFLESTDWMDDGLQIHLRIKIDKDTGCNLSLYTHQQVMLNLISQALLRNLMAT